MESREDRIAKNEALFREVNERVAEIDQRFGGDPEDADSLTHYMCECGNEGCLERLSLRRAEYEEVRAHPKRFLLLPGHETPAVERLIASNERFAVVEKHPEEARLAVERDPRA